MKRRKQMPSMYVTEEIEEKVDECQELIKEENGFKPDKVVVLDKALDSFIGEIGNEDGT